MGSSEKTFYVILNIMFCVILVKQHNNLVKLYGRKTEITNDNFCHHCRKLRYIFMNESAVMK